jgi:hypothetical protein
MISKPKTMGPVEGLVVAEGALAVDVLGTDDD